MAGGMMDYPPDIKDAVVTMNKAAQQLDVEMNDLKKVVQNLVGASQGAAILEYNQVHEMWDKSGLAHNSGLMATAKAAGDSYDEVTAFDAYLAGQLRP
jgi:hypothetical protein